MDFTALFVWAIIQIKMISIIHESKPTARKEYNCDACNFLFNLSDICELGLSLSEYRSVAKAIQNNYRIQKGSKYVRQFNTDGSEAWTFRAIPEINDICLKFDLYEE